MEANIKDILIITTKEDQENFKRLLGNGTHESLLDASNMIRTIENNKDTLICSPEIIGLNQQWLSLEKFSKRAILLNKNKHGQCLMKIAEKEIKKERANKN